MAAAPPITFEVNFVVPGEMRWCMRAKGMFDDWIHSDASSSHPIDQLPSADLSLQTDLCELHLQWIELRATNAWAAIRRASEIVEEVLPELLRTRALRVDAKIQNPDAEQRRPVGS
jgi:hypothetical protein